MEIKARDWRLGPPASNFKNAFTCQCLWWMRGSFCSTNFYFPQKKGETQMRYFHEKAGRSISVVFPTWWPSILLWYCPFYFDFSFSLSFTTLLHHQTTTDQQRKPPRKEARVLFSFSPSIHYNVAFTDIVCVLEFSLLQQQNKEKKKREKHQELYTLSLY